MARLGSPRKQRSGISPPGSGPSKGGNRFLEAASCHEQVFVGPDVLEPHHADAGAAAGCAAVQERPLGRFLNEILQGVFWVLAMAVARPSEALRCLDWHFAPAEGFEL